MKQIPLYEVHKSLGAKFSEFGGYEMPLWYNSAKKEHLAVIEGVGLFDTSHMSLLTITGSGSKELFKRCFSRDVDESKSGKSVYGLFFYKDRFVLDDALLYKREESFYYLVVNAGMSKSVIEYLESFGISDINITDYTGELCKLDIQGPKSLILMERLFGRDYFNDFPYFSFKGDFKDGGVLISRSGYTGEFGFEIFIFNKRVEELWNRILDTGDDLGIIPCGLAARDSLRVGAGLPLSHQDIGAWKFGNTPWDFCVDGDVSDSDSFTYMYVGYDVRKLVEDKGEVYLHDELIGSVLTCVSEVALCRVDDKILSIKSKELPEDEKVKGLVVGFIRVDKKLNTGEKIIIKDNKRSLTVEIVDDIRPHRTARFGIKTMRSRYE